jgi:hypothetical protein
VFDLFVYVREVASPLLAAASVRVDFTLDKALPPGNGGLSEVGLIAARAGLEAK